MKSILLIAALLVALGCATTPTGPAENTVDCKTYLAMEHDDIIVQWVNIFRKGLESNTDLGKVFWSCILSPVRAESAAHRVVRACRNNPDLDFDAAVLAQLETQFSKCGLTFKILEKEHNGI